MSDTVFVAMYHPALGNVRVQAPLIAVPTYEAHGWLLVDPGGTSPAPADINFTEALGDVRYLKLGDVGTAGTPTGDSLKAAYASSLSQRSIPRLPALPQVMTNPPTIAFVGAGNPTSSIPSAQFLAAVDVPYPGTPTGLSSSFAYRYGLPAQNNTYYAMPRQPTSSADLPYRVCGWFYGAKVEFGYRGQGDLSSRLWVDGNFAEPIYRGDSAQDGAPHLRSFTFAAAAWRYLEFECSAAFWGANIGPNDAWVPVVSPGADRLLVIGDSYGQGTGATSVFTGYAYQLGRMLGFDDVWSYSLGGTGVLAVNAPSPKYRDRAGDWAATKATGVLIQHSINDDSTSTDAINAEMVQLVAAVRANLPTLRHLWIQGPAPRGSSDLATKITRDQAFSSAAASLGVPYVSLVSPNSPWSSATDSLMMFSDGAHPSQAGHDAIARLGAYRLSGLLPGA